VYITVSFTSESSDESRFCYAMTTCKCRHNAFTTVKSLGFHPQRPVGMHCLQVILRIRRDRVKLSTIGFACFHQRRVMCPAPKFSSGVKLLGIHMHDAEEKAP
jgi:hypothetical protein